MQLEQALALVKASGYRVTKPRKTKAKKDRVGPTFIARFEDGTVTRMSTYTSLEKLDVARGVRLAHIAYESRHKIGERRSIYDRLACNPFMSRHAERIRELGNKLIPCILFAQFEQDGKLLATYPFPKG